MLFNLLISKDIDQSDCLKHWMVWGDYKIRSILKVMERKHCCSWLSFPSLVNFYDFKNSQIETRNEYRFYGFIKEEVY